jgi:CubicO group peptidase (beta-lactamase class C family)
VTVLLLLFGQVPVCEGLQNIRPSRNYWPTDEWRTSTPETQGMNSTILNRTDDFLDDPSQFVNIEEETRFNSIVIVRHGFIVYEKYLGMFDKDMPIVMQACTKSFTSTLVDIALERGYIESLNEFVFDYFQDEHITNWDTRKGLITIEHLLTMTSGLKWSEQSGDDYSGHMRFSDSWIEYILNLNITTTPGAHFQYCTGNSHLLAAILTMSTGQTPLAFAEEHLFEPLGIEVPYWHSDERGIQNGGDDLGMTPRDMARFGYLFLNDGSWDGEQIVSPEWASEATSTQVSLCPERGYGYHWWTSPDTNIFSARGRGGQSIIVAPDYDVVVVTTAKADAAFFESNCTCNNYYDSPSIDYILSNFILPSVDGYTPPNDEILVPMVIAITGVSVAAIVVIVFLKRRE